jgi:hypothetical protein
VPPSGVPSSPTEHQPGDEDNFLLANRNNHDITLLPDFRCGLDHAPDSDPLDLDVLPFKCLLNELVPFHHPNINPVPPALDPAPGNGKRLLVQRDDRFVNLGHAAGRDQKSIMARMISTATTATIQAHVGTAALDFTLALPWGPMPSRLFRVGAVRELGFVSVCELEVELEPGAS